MMGSTMHISFSMNSNKGWSTFRDNFADTMWHHFLSMIINDKEANEDEDEEEEEAKESNDDERDEKNRTMLHI